MNKFTNLRTFNPLLTLLLFVAVAFMSACGGDDEPTPDCSTLTLTAAAEGFTITATATGGTSPYEFQLDGGTVQSSGTFADLEAGSYVVTVIDANQCTKTQSVQVIDPCANFSVSATASAYDLTIAINDGAAPFSFTVSNGSTLFEDETSERSFTFELANAVNTTITITDANDCETTTEVTAEEIITFTDTDDQTYNVVKIGDQIWFAENYNKETAEGSYCYDNDETKCETYGRLYTWNEATSEGFAPEGWSLPSETDFQTLITTTGGGTESSMALEIGGSSGFEFELGGEYLKSFDEFDDLDAAGFLWSSDENPTDEERGVSLGHRPLTDAVDISNLTEKVNGLSVRLLKQ